MEIPEIRGLQNNPNTIEKLKQITPAWISVSEETQDAVVRNFRHRLLIVIDAHIAHFGNVYEWLSYTRKLIYDFI
jgi:hypothetical protein